MAVLQPNSASKAIFFRPACSHAPWVASYCLAGALLATITGCHSKQPGQIATRTHRDLDFNQDVQPILASNCFSCHGPDPEMRKGGLRLDLAESAFRKRPGHPDAIVPAILSRVN